VNGIQRIMIRCRIREVTAEGPIRKLGGIVEIDEAYIGGKQRGNRRDRAKFLVL